MRRVLISLLLCVGLSGPALAQSAEIEAVIGAQIEAFEADDFVTAFGFASPAIRRLFGNPENFGAMVRGGYPMVWRPAELRFLELRRAGGTLWQKVLVTDRAGVAHVLEYQMIELESGWKINGVRILDAAGVAA